MVVLVINRLRYSPNDDVACPVSPWSTGVSCGTLGGYLQIVMGLFSSSPAPTPLLLHCIALIELDCVLFN